LREALLNIGFSVVLLNCPLGSLARSPSFSRVFSPFFTQPRDPCNFSPPSFATKRCGTLSSNGSWWWLVNFFMYGDSPPPLPLAQIFLCDARETLLRCLSTPDCFLPSLLVHESQTRESLWTRPLGIPLTTFVYSLPDLFQPVRILRLSALFPQA